MVGGPGAAAPSAPALIRPCPPAEVKLYGSKYKAHDANYLKRTKEITTVEKTRNHYANVTAASSSQLLSRKRCSNNEKNS